MYVANAFCANTSYAVKGERSEYKEKASEQSQILYSTAATEIRAGPNKVLSMQAVVMIRELWCIVLLKYVY